MPAPTSVIDPLAALRHEQEFAEVLPAGLARANQEVKTQPQPPITTQNPGYFPAQYSSHAAAILALLTSPGWMMMR